MYPRRPYGYDDDEWNVYVVEEEEEEICDDDDDETDDYNPDIDPDYVDVQSDECDDELSDYVVEEPDWIPPPVCLPSLTSSSDDGSDEEESGGRLQQINLRDKKLIMLQNIILNCLNKKHYR